MPSVTSKDSLIRYAVEAVLIVLSVLLALYLDQTFENRREARHAAELVGHISDEIQGNLEILDDWLPYHEDVRARIESHLESSDGIQQLINGGVVDYGSLMERGLIQELYSTTAWQIALQTEITSSLEFEAVSAVSNAYLSQQLVDQTLLRLSDFFFDRNVHDAEQLEASLGLLRNLMQELAGQEHVLRSAYQDALQALDARYGPSH